MSTQPIGAAASLSGSKTVPYPATVLASNPLLYWRLGEGAGTSAFDSSSSGITGTFGSSVTLAQPGLLIGDPDRAVGMPGGPYAASKVITSPQTAVTQPTAALTVEMLLKPSRYPTSTCIIASCGFNGSTLGYSVGLSTVGQITVILSQANGLNATSVGAISVGVTSHVAVTYDSSNIRIYINGVLDSTTAHAGAISGYSGTNGFVVGDTSTGRPDVYSGVIDEVAVYGAALSAATLLQHANLSKGAFPSITLGAGARIPGTGAGSKTTPYAIRVIGSNPLLYWRLGEGTGTSAFDSSSSGITGTFGSSVALAQPGLLLGDPDRAVGLPGGPYAASKVITSPQTAVTQPTAALTVEMLLKPSRYPNSTCIIASCGFNGSTLGYSVGLSTAGQITVILSQANAFNATSVGTITVGATSHIAVTYDSANIRIYINGVLNTTTAHAGAIGGYSGTNGFVVGDTSSGRPDVYSGIVDEVAVYGTTLSAATVLDHYKASIYAVQTLGAGAAIASSSTTSSIPVSAGADISSLAHTPVGAGSVIAANSVRMLTGGAQIAAILTATSGGGAKISTEITIAAPIRAAAIIRATVLSALSAGAIIDDTPYITLGAAARIARSVATSIASGATVSQTLRAVCTAGARVTNATTLQLGAAGHLAAFLEEVLGAGAYIALPGRPRLHGGAIVSASVLKPLGAGAMIAPIVTASGGAVIASSRSLTAGALVAAAVRSAVTAGARILAVGTQTITAGARLHAIVSATAAGGANISLQPTAALSGGGTISVRSLRGLTAGAVIIVSTRVMLAGGAYVVRPASEGIGASARVLGKTASPIGAGAVVQSMSRTKAGAGARVSIDTATSLGAGARLVNLARESSAAAAIVSAIENRSARGGAYLVRFGSFYITAGAYIVQPGDHLAAGGGARVIVESRQAVGGGAAILREINPGETWNRKVHVRPVELDDELDLLYSQDDREG
jgi:hypothetical protein